MEREQGEYRTKKDRENSGHNKPGMKQWKRSTDCSQTRKVSGHGLSNIPQVGAEPANLRGSMRCFCAKPL